MCLPDFKEFKNILENEPLTGYRTWKNPILDNNLELHSEHIDYIWKPLEGPHLVAKSNSGIYAYNNYYYYYNNNYYNNYYNYYNNYYYLFGIIKQWGITAIHGMGQRSEYAVIDKLFTIRELDAKGPQDFLGWIKIFNEKINQIAEKYNCQTIHWQDFILRSEQYYI